MRSLAIFSILASLVLFLSPLLSNAGPLPLDPDHQHLGCYLLRQKCHQLAGGNNPREISADIYQSAAECYEQNYKDSHADVNHESCAGISRGFALDTWHKRAKVLRTADVMMDEIRRVMTKDIYQSLAGNEKNRYIWIYVRLMDKSVVSNSVISELDQFVKAKKLSRPHAVTRKVDHEKVTEDDNVRAFFSKWVDKIFTDNDLEDSLRRYEHAVYARHLPPLLQKFGADCEGKSTLEVSEIADRTEESGQHSEMYMAESLLFRYISVEREPTRQFLEEQEQRLENVSKRWPKLKGLINWFRLEFENYSKSP